MSFPPSHTGVHHSWQFVLFVEINESFVVLLIVELEEKLHEWNIRIYFPVIQKPPRFKKPLEYPGFTLSHNAKLW